MNLAKANFVLKNLNKKFMHGLTSIHPFGETNLSNVHVNINKPNKKDNGIFTHYFKTVFDSHPDCSTYSVKYLLSLCSDIGYQLNEANISPKTIDCILRIGVIDDKCTAILVVGNNYLFDEYSDYLAPIHNLFEEKMGPKEGSPFLTEFLGFKQKVPLNRFRFFQLKENEVVQHDNRDVADYLIRSKLKEKLSIISEPNITGSENYSFKIYLPEEKNLKHSLNYELCIYLLTYYLGNLVRYEPETLYKLLDTESNWLLTSFIDISASRYIRSYVSRLLLPMNDGYIRVSAIAN